MWYKVYVRFVVFGFLTGVFLTVSRKISAKGVWQEMELPQRSRKKHKPIKNGKVSEVVFASKAVMSTRQTCVLSKIITDCSKNDYHLYFLKVYKICIQDGRDLMPVKNNPCFNLS